MCYCACVYSTAHDQLHPLFEQARGFLRGFWAITKPLRQGGFWATRKPLSYAPGHTHTGLLLSSQLHNASQLSTWCLHFISNNYGDFKRNEQFLQLDQDSLSYVEEHRWPPLSYETAMKEYKTKYLDILRGKSQVGVVYSHTDIMKIS